MNKLMYLFLITIPLWVGSCSKEYQTERNLKGQWDLESVEGSIVKTFTIDGIPFKENSTIEYIQGDMIVEFETSPENYNWLGNYDIQIHRLVDNNVIYNTVTGNGFLTAGSWDIVEEGLYLTSGQESHEFYIQKLDNTTLKIEYSYIVTSEEDNEYTSSEITKSFKFTKRKKMNWADL